MANWQYRYPIQKKSSLLPDEKNGKIKKFNTFSYMKKKSTYPQNLHNLRQTVFYMGMLNVCDVIRNLYIVYIYN